MLNPPDDQQAEDPKVIRLTSNLPCSIDKPSGKCNLPAQAGYITSAGADGAWILKPVCRSCAKLQKELAVHSI